MDKYKITEEDKKIIKYWLERCMKSKKILLYGGIFVGIMHFLIQSQNQRPYLEKMHFFIFGLVLGVVLTVLAWIGFLIDLKTGKHYISRFLVLFTPFLENMATRAYFCVYLRVTIYSLRLIVVGGCVMMLSGQSMRGDLQAGLYVSLGLLVIFQFILEPLIGKKEKEY